MILEERLGNSEPFEGILGCFPLRFRALQGIFSKVHNYLPCVAALRVVLRLFESFTGHFEVFSTHREAFLWFSADFSRCSRLHSR